MVADKGTAPARHPEPATMTTPFPTALRRPSASKPIATTRSPDHETDSDDGLVSGMLGVSAAGQDVAVARRLEEWRETFRPETPDEEWHYHQLVVESVRLERLHKHQATLLAYHARRATACWA